MSEKQCSMCQQTKSLEQFEKEKRAKDGRGARCRLCKNDPKPYKAFWRLKAKQKLYDIPIETSKEEVAQIFEMFEGKCAYCHVEESSETGTMNLEHIRPMKAGGRHHVSNLCVSCKFCNSKKQDKPLIEFYRSHEPFTGAMLDFVFFYVAYFSNRDVEEVAKEFYAEVKDD